MYNFLFFYNDLPEINHECFFLHKKGNQESFKHKRGRQEHKKQWTSVLKFFRFTLSKIILNCGHDRLRQNLKEHVRRTFR